MSHISFSSQGYLVCVPEEKNRKEVE
jgi:hypothetical protein